MSMNDMVQDLKNALPNADEVGSLPVDEPLLTQLAPTQSVQPEKPEVKSENSVLSMEEMEILARKKRYYEDALVFTLQLNGAVPCMTEMLASKTKSDVVESIQFFVSAHRNGLSRAQVREN